MAVRVRIGAKAAAPQPQPLPQQQQQAPPGAGVQSEIMEQHFIMRFPEDVARRLKDAQPPSVSLVEISDSEYEVTVGSERMHGRKFELPTHLETFKLFNFSVTGSSSAGLNAGAKVADVHELLVVARDRKSLDEISDSLLSVDGLSMLPSGLLPPMQHVVERRFRKSGQISDHQRNSVRSAESAILSIVGGGHLEWEELQQVEKIPDFSRAGAIEENASIWEPTSTVLDELRAAGLMDAHGNLAPISDSSDDDADDETLSLGGSSRAPPSRRTGAGVGIRIGSGR